MCWFSTSGIADAESSAIGPARNRWARKPRPYDRPPTKHNVLKIDYRKIQIFQILNTSQNYFCIKFAVFE